MKSFLLYFIILLLGGLYLAFIAHLWLQPSKVSQSVEIMPPHLDFGVWQPTGDIGTSTLPAPTNTIPPKFVNKTCYNNLGCQ